MKVMYDVKNDAIILVNQIAEVLYYYNLLDNQGNEMEAWVLVDKDPKLVNALNSLVEIGELYEY